LEIGIMLRFHSFNSEEGMRICKLLRGSEIWVGSIGISEEEESK
jgi:hypothetical protein